jgi:6-pyruvoyltetrahydropterin/6-carboxytetrahydropterin synthase
MHRLTRQVCFSVGPFLFEDAIYLQLSVQLEGDVEPATGFVVNVADIDSKVSQFVVPIFAGQLRADFQQGKSIGLSAMAELLRSAWRQLADKFAPAPVLRQEDAGVRLTSLRLKLNPFRELAIDSKESAMVYFSEKFDFAAGHKLWNDKFSRERNFEIFGKCANPAGHGHNYVVEVTIKKSANGGDFCIGDFERIVNDQLIRMLDHKNLNVDVAEFNKINPTVENIAAFAWNKLVGKFGRASLHCVTVWETEKTCCSYYGDGK